MHYNLNKTCFGKKNKKSLGNERKNIIFFENLHFDDFQNTAKANEFSAQKVEDVKTTRMLYFVVKKRGCSAGDCR